MHTSLDTNLPPYLRVCFSVSLVRVNQKAGDVAEDGLGEVGHFGKLGMSNNESGWGGARPSLSYKIIVLVCLVCFIYFT